MSPVASSRGSPHTVAMVAGVSITPTLAPPITTGWMGETTSVRAARFQCAPSVVVEKKVARNSPIASAHRGRGAGGTGGGPRRTAGGQPSGGCQGGAGSIRIAPWSGRLRLGVGNDRAGGRGDASQRLELLAGLEAHGLAGGDGHLD